MSNKPLSLENLNHLDTIAAEDAAGLKKAAQSYGDSWKKRGGAGAFMMLARKWDRIENALDPAKADPSKPLAPGIAPMSLWNGVTKQVPAFDILEGLSADTRPEGLIDDIRDLRRYLMLIESEARAQGSASAISTHRDNKVEKTPSPYTGEVKKTTSPYEEEDLPPGFEPCIR